MPLKLGTGDGGRRQPLGGGAPLQRGGQRAPCSWRSCWRPCGPWSGPSSWCWWTTAPGTAPRPCCAIWRQRVPELVAVLLRRNYGQTAAMAAGFDASTGAVIVTLDGDLQNDPADIPLLLDRLEQDELDLVSGWRHQRQDGALDRLLPSLLANRLIARVTGVQAARLRLLPQGLPAGGGERHESLRGTAPVPAGPGLHRRRPDRRGEGVPPSPPLRPQQLRHRSHLPGADGPADGVVHEAVPDPADARVRLRRPADPGGRAGHRRLAGGGEAAAGSRHRQSPLLLMAVLAILSGVQIFCFGLLAELQMRTYHESQGGRSTGSAPPCGGTARP